MGRDLLRSAEEALGRRGYLAITLWVLERNQLARSFYERLGYTPDGARKDVAMGDAMLRDVRYVKSIPGTDDVPGCPG